MPAIPPYLPRTSSRAPAPAPARPPRLSANIPVETQGHIPRLLADLLRLLQPSCRPLSKESRRADRIDRS